MLEDLEKFQADQVVHRLANFPDFTDMLRRMGLHATDIDEILQFLGELAEPSHAAGLLDAPFAPKPQLSARQIVATRFSDGSRRVFYSALEPETAESEVVYWYAAAALGHAPRVVYYNRLRCRFRGEAMDLRPMSAKWPFLMADGEHAYTRCQELANEAVELDIAGFFVPSARRALGTNVPVFQRAALEEPSILGSVAISRDQESGQLIVRRA